MIIMNDMKVKLPKAPCPNCNAIGTLTWVAIDPDDADVKDAAVCDCSACNSRVTLKTDNPSQYVD